MYYPYFHVPGLSDGRHQPENIATGGNDPSASSQGSLCRSGNCPHHRRDPGARSVTAEIAHLSHSTPSAFHFQSSAFTDYSTVQIATGGTEVRDGLLIASDAPGLGVEPDFGVLGDPLFVTTGAL